MSDENKTEQTYTAPAVSELGTVVEVTLGSAGNDQADDTQYYQ
ncbi:lasso RiPP family leader peptide-containing protein [Streptomyces sp. NPDC015125]